MQTRSALANDLPALRALLEGAALPSDGVEAQFPDGYAVVEIEGTVRAAAGVERFGRTGLLRSVVVDGGFRVHGLGRMLVADRMKWAAMTGLSELYLLTTTAPDFFARLGFKRIDRATAPEAIRASLEFASLCPSSAVCMHCALETH